jgi:hypothetical protein
MYRQSREKRQFGDPCTSMSTSCWIRKSRLTSRKLGGKIPAGALVIAIVSFDVHLSKGTTRDLSFGWKGSKNTPPHEQEFPTLHPLKRGSVIMLFLSEE